jgi:LemA protein
MRGSTLVWVLGGIAVVAILFGLYIAGTYNGLVSNQVNVDNNWAKVQTAYQRRADLIPNLVTTVKAYSDYEGSVLTDITNARAKVGQAQTPKELNDAGTQLDSALSRLLVVVENYPTLKANENYLSLQDELAGTENRIKVERDNFNDAVKTYNINVRSFPSNMIAGMFGFTTKEMFEAAAGSEVVPTVNFN